MVDRKALELELEEARRARLEAQAAGSHLEDLIGLMRSGRSLEQIELGEPEEKSSPNAG
jgi:hypothetical protein